MPRPALFAQVEPLTRLNGTLFSVVGGDRWLDEHASANWGSACVRNKLSARRPIETSF